MKIIILGVLFIALNTSVFAQSSGYYLGINSGFSIPIGEYNNKNLDNGCFTQTGFTVGLEGAWYFKKHLGVGAQFSYALHPVDVGSLGYEKVISDPFLKDLTIRSDPYQIISSAMGLFYKWNFKSKWSVYGKLMAGVMWAKTPYQLYKPEYFLMGPEYFEITSSRDSNIMGIIGGGIRIDLSPCIALSGGGEFQYSKMKFGFQTASTTRYDYRNIAFINASISLVFVL